MVITIIATGSRTAFLGPVCCRSVTFWYGSGIRIRRSVPLTYRSVSRFGSGSESGAAILRPMLWICDILVQIRILRSVPLTYGSVPISGYGSASCFFLFFWIIFALLDPDPDSESGIRIRNPNLESASAIRIPNLEYESGIQIRNPESESGFQNPNPEYESGVRIRIQIHWSDWIRIRNTAFFGWNSYFSKKIIDNAFKNLKILLKEIQIAFNFVTLLISLYTSPRKGGV
jgi:hypothetical protein